MCGIPPHLPQKYLRIWCGIPTLVEHLTRCSKLKCAVSPSPIILKHLVSSVARGLNNHSCYTAGARSCCTAGAHSSFAPSHHQHNYPPQHHHPTPTTTSTTSKNIRNTTTTAITTTTTTNPVPQAFPPPIQPPTTTSTPSTPPTPSTLKLCSICFDLFVFISIFLLCSTYAAMHKFCACYHVDFCFRFQL